MAASAWTADYPDAQNFLQLLYGPNTGQSNEARFRLAEYDRLYRLSQAVPDSPRGRPVPGDEPPHPRLRALAPGRSPRLQHLQYPWVKGYKKHPILYTNFKYLDLDVAARQAASK